MIQDIIYRQCDINDAGYQQVWQLREDILRKPLGMSLKNEDLSADADDIILTAVHDEKVIGCLMLQSIDSRKMKLRQMAVAADWQGKDVGRKLVERAELLCADLGYTKVVLHARQLTIGFYSKLGYAITSDLFTEVGIPHVVMEKKIAPAIA